MGWLRVRLLLSVNYLVLMWTVGSSSIEVLLEPTCYSDYISSSTCEWQLDGAVNCSAELRLAYWLDFEFHENNTCIPENSATTACICRMFTDNPVKVDTYRLDLWAGRRLLWHGSFIPSSYVKPPVPGNLTVHTNISNAWLLTWDNPYPPRHFLYSRLTYMVNISRVDDPADFKVHNVTYVSTKLQLQASTLKSGVSYSAQVRVWVQSFNSTWSEWSPSIKWYNHFPPPLAQRLPLGVGVSCVGILLVCLSCYVCVSRVKKMWWDQIPTPARSPLVAIIIQDSKVSLWEKQARSQESTKCPRWKSCLTKLLPCLLEHSTKRGQESLRTAETGPLQGAGKPAWCPVEVSRTVLQPENVSMSVVRCEELSEAPGESEEEEEEEEDTCTLPEDSVSGFQEGRAGIVARLTENLFMDLLGPEDRGFDQPTLGESCLPLPSECGQDLVPWASFPPRPKEATCWATDQPLHSEAPPGNPTHSPASLACTQVPVIADNPAYRSFSHFQSQSSSPGEPTPDPLQTGHSEEGNLPNSGDSSGPPVQQTEPESWEQILHLSVLRHAAAVPVPASGYREFMQAVREGAAQDPRAAGLGPCGDPGYKAFSSLLTNNTLCGGTAGPGTGSEGGGYEPFRDLIPDPSPCPMPLFTFGLGTEPPSSPPDSPPPGSTPECLGLEPELKEGSARKAPVPTEPLEDDLGLGIVYSALTCHLCGHLKQHHGQEEGGQGHVVASPCCGCCCGDRSPPGSPSGSLDTSLQGLPQETRLTPVPRPPSGFSGEGKIADHTHLSSQNPKVRSLVPMGAQGVVIS